MNSAMTLREWTAMQLTELPLADLRAAQEMISNAEAVTQWDAAERHLPIEPACAICGAHGKALWGVEFYDYDTGGYPSNPWRLAVRWHCESVDDEHQIRGYGVALGQILSHAPFNAKEWHTHLSGKPWYHASFLADLEETQRVWRDQLERAAAKNLSAKPGFASIPKRPPRAPGNPRHIRPAMRAYVMERDNFTCRRCGHGTSDGVKLVVDHIVAVANGGTGEASNLQTLCQDCNAGKSDRPPHPHDQRGR